MSWTPLIEIDQGKKSASEAAKELNAIEAQRAIITTLGAIEEQLKLLNLRFEEAFETGIDGADI